MSSFQDFSFTSFFDNPFLSPSHSYADLEQNEEFQYSTLPQKQPTQSNNTNTIESTKHQENNIQVEEINPKALLVPKCQIDIANEDLSLRETSSSLNPAQSEEGYESLRNSSAYSESEEESFKSHEFNLPVFAVKQKFVIPTPSPLSSLSKKIHKEIERKNLQSNLKASHKSIKSNDDNEPACKRRTWTTAEDNKVLELIKAHGQSWTTISKQLGGRSPKQIRDRYINRLMPDIKKGNWTDVEDRLLMRLFEEYGHKWSRIATFLSGRTESQVKNRFNSTIKKRLIKKRNENNVREEKQSLNELISEAKQENDLIQKSAEINLMKFYSDEQPQHTFFEESKTIEIEDHDQDSRKIAMRPENESQTKISINENPAVVTGIEELTKRVQQLQSLIVDTIMQIRDIQPSFNLNSVSQK